ncbi:MAG: translocation/assembly module TamB domain-containing protein [Candidatus Eremiobacteraeota bacterium]|nr:translocation/assembly module TamB domain-containing protein [Candidatus Eremiobacteraeota bacterium]
MRGTFAKPQFSAAFDASDVDAYGVKVPSIFGALRWNQSSRAIALSNAGVQFEHGDISIAGSMPLQLQPFGLGPQNARVSFTLAVNGFDPATVQTLLGNNTKLGGTVDGELAIEGTVANPRIYGRFALANGSYVSDLERSPITNIATALAFDRTQATVQHFFANVGRGTVDATGRIAFGQGTGAATYIVSAHAKDAELALPQLGAGALDGDPVLQREAHKLAELSGGLTLHDANIPFSAFLLATQSSQSGSGQGGLPRNLGFNLNLQAANNVRVRGSGFGAGLDIGATGGVLLAGTLDDPTLDGRFVGTGGTLVYFDRAFRLQNADVTFTPSQGIIPTLRVAGITHVSNPDPRIPGTAVDVTINVDGPINALKVAFTSSPPGYTNEQILAMIAPFGGLIGGVASGPASGNQSINGVTPYGALNVVPGAQPLGPTSSVSLGQEAFNILNAQFTAGVLAPFENAVSQGLGFQNFSLNVDYYGTVGFSATRLLGKTVNFIYSQTFGTPSRYSAGLELVGANTSAQLSFYWTTGPLVLFQTPNGIASNSRLSVGQPLQGQSGFAFTLQRLYW